MNRRAHNDAVSHFVKSTHETGLKLHVRVRGDGSGGKPVLFVHGATYASRLYDLPQPGASWLAATAAVGFTAYALDIRGYGLSRSLEMELAKKPYARATCAIKDIDDTVRWICDRHGTNDLCVVGGSWGSITSALYASTFGKPRVSRLVLYAPIFCERNEGWLSTLADPRRSDRMNPNWGAFRWIDEAGTRARWNANIPGGQVDDWRDEAVFRALVHSSFADDPLSETTSPRAFRAPNGTFVDLWEAFNGHTLYDPADLNSPLLLIRGSQDTTSTRKDALALFDRVGSVSCSYVEIANGSHFLNAERRAPEVFAAANAFLMQ
jgi:pimeloyl-ACP methyl ester carboxylesterase